MAHETLATLDLENPSPARLWHSLDPESRRLAARALFTQAQDDPALRHQTNETLARALRFREVTIRKMPVDKKAGYMARLVKPDDALASSLLLALHLEERRQLLKTFLDALGIVHEDGVISGEDELEPPAPKALEAAVKSLDQSFGEDEVDVYLATLLSMDDETWAGLRPILEKRSPGGVR